MSSLILSIRTPKSYLAYNKTGSKHENMNKLINLLSGLNAGVNLGEVYVSGSSTATLVAAAATATLTYGSLANNVDTWVGYGVTLTCVTGTPAASDATTGQFKKETDATVTAVNLATKINAHSVLSKYVYATSALGVVTITSNFKGTIGNFLTTHTSAGTGIANAAYSGGLGGVESIPVQLR
jgi:phage tail sheath gpL-like